MSINEKMLRFDNSGREVKKNPYYSKISGRLRFIKYLLLIALTFYTVFMLCVFHESITYDNLMYLLRDFNSSPAGEGMFSRIEFLSQDCASVKLFRGELASAGKTETVLYGYSGQPSFEYKELLEEPVIKSSDKYMLVYDFGGNKYSLYTSVTRVLNAESEDEIIAADVCESGEFLIAEKSKEAKFKVTVYDTSFRPVAKYYKNSYLTSAVLSPDGKNVIISSLDMSLTDIRANVEIYRIGEETASAQYSENGVFPFGIEILKNGSFVLKTSGSLVYFDKNGSVLKREPYNGGYSLCESDGENILVVTENGGASETASVFVYDSLGNEKLSAFLDFVPDCADISSEALYFAGGKRAEKISIDGEKTTVQLEIEVSGIVALGKYAFVYDSSEGMSVFN